MSAGGAGCQFACCLFNGDGTNIRRTGSLRGTPLSRLSRSLKDFLNIFEFAQRHACGLVCLKTDIDTTSPYQGLVTKILNRLQLMGGMAGKRPPLFEHLLILPLVDDAFLAGVPKFSDLPPDSPPGSVGRYSRFSCRGPLERPSRAGSASPRR